MEAWVGGIESWMKVLGFGASVFLKVFNAVGSGFLTARTLRVLVLDISLLGFESSQRWKFWVIGHLSGFESSQSWKIQS